MKTSAQKLCVGAPGGEEFGHHQLPRGARLSCMHIHAGDYVDGIQLEYETSSGATGLSAYIGGIGGKRHSFRLGKGESVIGVTGRSGWYLDAIRFHTNKRVSPVFGGSGGQKFALNMGGNRPIRGIHGRADDYVHGLGFILGSGTERSKQDDLLMIPGVGPAALEVFDGVGIDSFQQLAQLSSPQLREILKEAGIQPGKGGGFSLD